MFHSPTPVELDLSLLMSQEVWTISVKTGRTHWEVAWRVANFLAWGMLQSRHGSVPWIGLASMVQAHPDTDLSFWQAVASTGLVEEVPGGGLRFPPSHWVRRVSKKR